MSLSAAQHTESFKDDETDDYSEDIIAMPENEIIFLYLFRLLDYCICYANNVTASESESQTI